MVSDDGKCDDEPRPRGRRKLLAAAALTASAMFYPLGCGHTYSNPKGTYYRGDLSDPPDMARPEDADVEDGKIQ